MNIRTVEGLAREVATLLMDRAKKQVTQRMGLVLVAAFFLRAALDSLSPDERTAMRTLALDYIDEGHCSRCGSWLKPRQRCHCERDE